MMTSFTTIPVEGHQILTASISTAQIPLLLRNKLLHCLPYSLPLYRRCQFHLHEVGSGTPPSSKEPGEPEVWVAVSMPRRGTGFLSTSASTSQDWLTEWLNTSIPLPPAKPSTTQTTTQASDPDPDPSSWLATHIDLREPGQTQIWLFGSWEAHLTPLLMSSSPPAFPSTTNTSTKTPDALQTTLARALFQHLRTHHIPVLSLAPSAQFQTLKATGKIVSSPYRRSNVLFGTIAEASWWMLEDQIVKGEGKGRREVDPGKASMITREDRPYLKYLLPLPLPSSLSSSSSVSLLSTEPTFRPAPLSTSHLQTMLDRSTIPRTLETLQKLPSLGLFPSTTTSISNCNSSLSSDPIPVPVSWGILGKDASISSLHTEDGYRGKGLAELVVRELVNEELGKGGIFGQAEAGDGGEIGEGKVVEWAHTDVSVSNVASRRVFEKLGAKVGWRVGWVEIDVGED